MIQTKLKILFIGGNGNISHHCVLEAVRQGHDVYVLARGVTFKTRRVPPSQVTQVKIDYSDKMAVSLWIEKNPVDVVIDFLCYHSVDAEAAIGLFHGRVSRYVFISSVTVYKRPAKLPFRETSERWLNTDYGYALEKLNAEKAFVKAYERLGFPVTIIRPAHTYDTIVPVSIGHNCYTVPRRYLEGKPVLIAGDGTNLWTLTHSSDLAVALIELLQIESTVGQDYHITSDEYLNWLEITRHLLDALNILSNEDEWIHIPTREILKMELPKSQHMKISFLGKAYYGQRMWCDIYDNQKIKKTIPNWHAKTNFQTGIKQTITWLQQDPHRQRINDDLNKLLDDLTDRFS